jgi:hypothetical protein
MTSGRSSSRLAVSLQFVNQSLGSIKPRARRAIEKAIQHTARNMTTQKSWRRNSLLAASQEP